MGTKFLEKIAPYYFLLSTMGCISLVGTLVGLIIYFTNGKKLMAGTRLLYLVMAFWTILANIALVLFISVVGGDPTVASEVEAM